MIPWPWIVGIGAPALALVGLVLWVRSLRAKVARLETSVALAKTEASAAKDAQLAEIERGKSLDLAWRRQQAEWEAAQGRVREALTGSTADAKGLRDDLELCIATGSPDHAHAWLDRVFASRAPGGAPGDADASAGVPAPVSDGPGTTPHRRDPEPGQ